jgi:uncharacterized protein
MKTRVRAHQNIMTNESEQTMVDSSPNPLAFDPVTGQPLPPQPSLSQPIAPIWHTVLMVVLLLGNSFASAVMASRVASDNKPVSDTSRFLEYASTIGLELFLLLLVWLGLRQTRTKLRDIIGGRWDTAEHFLLDVAIGFGCCIVGYVMILGLAYAVGLAKPEQMEGSKKLASMIAPHTVGALLLFIALSFTAGFVEEIIFRGYLQRQLGALSGNIYVGLVASAVVFGAGHGYEGGRRMLLVFCLGLLFGFLALLRKSLRPGMIAHALFDSAQGILLFLVYRTGVIPH